MDLDAMIALVRQDLKDEDDDNYRWTDDELERHINRAVKEFSWAIPLEAMAEVATETGSREIDISDLAERVMIEAVEYPQDLVPRRYQRFSVWGNTLTLLGADIPDGSDCNVYYGQLHSLDGEDGSTIPMQYEDLVASGAAGYAAIAWAGYAINRVNTGGTGAAGELQSWGQKRIDFFRSEIRRLGRKHRVRISHLYTPYHPIISKSTDWGPA